MKICWSAVLSAAAILTLCEAAPAQLITMRTLPVAQADQFEIYPSQHLGMGGVSIALPDTLLDPFRNPAKGARLRTSRVFSAPGIYEVSSQSGAGRTLPLGALLRTGAWFGAFAVALQEVDPGQRINPISPPILAVPGLELPVVPNTTPDNRSHSNTLGAFLLGRRIQGGASAIAASVQLAHLAAVDGVDLLYGPSAARVGQSGNSFDVRFGFLREWDGDQSLEVLALHNRYRMRHDVTFVDQFWDPDTQQPIGVPRVDAEHDRSSTWGVHVAYERPLPGTAWRIGGLLTANRIEHEAMPAYDLMSVPSSPGTSYAANLGVGLSRRRGSETFGVDFIYEPARMHTAESVAGAPALDNRFRFSNANVRVGFAWDLDPATADRGATMQLGLVVRAIRYRLDQTDLATGDFRQMAQSWTEWTPTWGLGLAFTGFELRYRGRISNGTSRPATAPFGGGCCFAPDPVPGPFPGPGFPMELRKVHVMTHQISLSLPLR